MMQKVRSILMVLNGFLILAVLYFGLPVFRAGFPTSKRSHKETVANVEKTTDLEKLKTIVKADDAAIRADRTLASLFRQGAITVSAIAVIVGIANILLLQLCPKNKTPI